MTDTVNVKEMHYTRLIDSCDNDEENCKCEFCKELEDRIDKPIKDIDRQRDPDKMFIVRRNTKTTNQINLNNKYYPVGTVVKVKVVYEE